MQSALVRVFFLLILGVTVSMSGCQKGAEQSDDKIRLALNWYPDAQHGGFYAALLNGYYEEEGLDVEIIAGGPNVPVMEKVSQGRAEFGVSNADQLLLKRNQGATLVAVLAPIQNSPRCILVHRESGIDSFEKLQGVTLALGPGRPFAEYLKRHATLDNVQFVNYSGSVARFLADKSFAQQGYVFSEPFVAQQQGADPVCLMLSDIGFNPYTSCLFVDAKTIDDNPERVAKMVRATQRGWQAYLESPEKVNAYIHKLNSEMDRESLTFASEKVRELCLPDGMSTEELGKMTPERWNAIAEQLKEIEYVDSDFSVEGSYQMLPEALQE